MSESLNRQLADLHAERLATWAPAALQINIDQRQRLVASDKDNNLGRRLGILYRFDEASRNAALAKGNSIGETTGTGTWELPQPTVVVIAKDGSVAFVQVSPDWLVRTEAEPVLQVVEQLLGQQPVRLAI